MTYFAGQGSQLKRGQAVGDTLPAPASDTFDAVNLLGNLKPPDDSRTQSSFKTLDKKSSHRVGGGFDDRTVSFRLVLDTSDPIHLAIQADGQTDSSTQARRNWQLILADSGAMTANFVGYVSKWTWEQVENDKEGAATVEISVDGDVTWTA